MLKPGSSSRTVGSRRTLWRALLPAAASVAALACGSPRATDPVGSPVPSTRGAVEAPERPTVSDAIDAARAGDSDALAALDPELRLEAHWALDSIGMAAEDEGRLDAARERYALALRLADAPEDELVILNRLALLQKALGRPDSAILFLRAGLEIAGDSVEPGSDMAYFLNGTLSNLGLAFDESNLPDSAVFYHQAAIRTAGAAEVMDEELALTLNNLGVSWRRAGFPDSALALYDRAEAAGMDDPALLALNRGLVFGDRGDTDAAREALESALQLRTDTGSPAGRAEVERHLAGLIHRVSGDPAGAVELYARAAASLEEARAELATDAARVSWADVSGNLTLFSDWADAILDAGLTEGAALAASERGRAQSLSWMLREPALSRGGSPPGSADAPDGDASTRAALDALRALGMAALIYDLGRDDLRIWAIRPDGQIQVRRCRIPSWQIGAWIEGYREELVPWGASVRRRGLEIGAPTGDAGLRRQTADNRFVSPDGDPRLSDPINCSDGDPAPSSGGQNPDPGGRLASLLLPGDFLAELPPGQELLIVPSGDLTLLPFAALSTGGVPLGHRTALTYAPSLEVWRLGALRASGTRESGAGTARVGAASRATPPLVVADPTMPESDAAGGAWNLDPLPGARREGAAVADLLGVDALIGDAATEEAFQQAAASASVIHLATHGVAFAEPARSRQSFLALASTPDADGFLSVDEVMDPDRFPDLVADLVVLSACQTGLGEIRGAEGTIGLQRAFLSRGARSVLVSLWSVSDEGTYDFITTFYRFWQTEGLAPAEALRRAQVSLAAEGYGPADWAAFQLFGQG